MAHNLCLMCGTLLDPDEGRLCDPCAQDEAEAAEDEADDDSWEDWEDD